MGKKAYFIFSFQNFLEAVDFNESFLEDQIAYQLFYVTKIARLRKDMTPNILSDRLNDQIRILNEKYSKGETYSNLNLTTPESVKDIIINTPKYFAITPHNDMATDRNDNQKSYVLTKYKEEELKKKQLLLER